MRRYIYIYFLFSLIMLAIIIANNIRLELSKKNVISAIVFIVAYYLYKSPSLFETIGFSISAFIIISLNDQDKVNCWHFIFKWFAILMIPSLLIYAIYHTIGFPSLGIIKFSDSEYISSDYLIRKNFFFYNTPFEKAGWWIRFNGPFNEPGHLGMMTAFMLFADGFILKKKSTIIIILSLVLSLSLAGYVLGIIGYAFARFEQKKVSLKWLLPIISLVGMIYIIGSFYNGGDNIINEYVISRFEYDEDRVIAGNNRASARHYFYFEMMQYDREMLLKGIGKEEVDALHESGRFGTGFVAWIVEFGLLGVIQALLFYIVYLFFSKNRIDIAISFLFIVLMFVQRSYPYWFAWVICYIYGTTLLSRQTYGYVSLPHNNNLKHHKNHEKKLCI